MNIRVRFQNSAWDAFLTTEHPGRSYGLPVLVPGFGLSHYMQKACYGPGDLKEEPILVLDGPATAEEISQIKAAGFKIRDY